MFILMNIHKNDTNDKAETDAINEREECLVESSHSVKPGTTP
jgi:hypothetical protein